MTNPTDADPFVNSMSPLTPEPPLLGIDGNPTADALK